MGDAGKPELIPTDRNHPVRQPGHRAITKLPEHDGSRRTLGVLSACVTS
jgi:hypothetical protein